MNLPGTTTISVERLAHLQALESNVVHYLSAKTFPDMVLAKNRLQRMTGIGDVRYLDQVEREWTKHKADVDRILGRGETTVVRTRTRAAQPGSTKTQGAVGDAPAGFNHTQE